MQAVYDNIRESIALLLRDALVDSTEQHRKINGILNSLDDAVSNNWEELMESFWTAIRSDETVVTEKRFMDKVFRDFPDALVGEDDEGQILIHTGLTFDKDGNVVLMGGE